MKLISFSFILIFFLYAYAEAGLVLVSVLFRHGCITPKKHAIYPNDIFNEKTFYPFGFSQLTNFGKTRAHKLGRNLRDRYGWFLGDYHTPDMMKMITTDVDRTKTSALTVLAGLFPPTGTMVWNDNLNWMPIPYDYIPEKKDFVLRRVGKFCPIYHREFLNVLNSTEARTMLADNAETLEYMSNKTGKTIDNFIPLYDLYGTLKAESAMHLTLPEWTQSVFPDKLSEFAATNMKFETYNTLLRRLSGGPALKMILDDMNATLWRKRGYENKKLYMYSAHEHNIGTVLGALGLFQPHVPDYSSALYFELHYNEDEREYVVKLYYARNVYEYPEFLTIPGCEEECPLNQLKEILKPVLPGDMKEECQLEKDESS